MEGLRAGIWTAKLLSLPRIRPRDDHKVRILAFLDRATDALNEDFQVHDVFPLELAAPLVKDLM
jgi:hypothetical protein